MEFEDICVAAGIAVVVLLAIVGIFYIFSGVSSSDIINKCEKEGYYNIGQTIIQCNIVKPARELS